MKKTLLLPLLTLSGMAYAGKDTIVQNCNVPGACHAAINAIGDAVTIDIPESQITALGTIAADKTVKITLPKEAGEMKAYRFTPTAGEAQGQVVTIVFDNIMQKPGTRNFGKTFIKVYRRFASDTESTWYEIGNMTFAGLLKDKPEQVSTDITIKTDGTSTWVNPQTQKPMVFLAGTKDLKAAAAA